MERTAKMALAAMINSFPQKTPNHDLLLRTYEEALRDTADAIVCEIAGRFTSGKVDGQSLTYAPSVAEFCHAARKLIELRVSLCMITDKRLPATHELVFATVNRAKNEYSGREPIAKNIDHFEFLKMVKRREIPPGSEFVAILRAVYAPKQENRQPTTAP